MAEISPDTVEVGVITKAHGIKGELRVRLHNPKSDVLVPKRVCWLERSGDAQLRLGKVTSVRSAGGDLLIRLEDVADRTQAETMPGTRIRVDRSLFPEPEADEYYHFELMGMTAIDAQGTELGRLEEVIELPGADVYVIRGGARGELMVPAIGTFVGTIDRQARTLTVLNVDDLSGD